MAVISAAALGALLGASMRTGKRVGKTRRLRGTRNGMSMGSYRRVMRARGRSRPMSKRRWQASARRKVGNPKNYSTSKTAESINPGSSAGANRGSFIGLGSINTKTIGSVPLIQIDGTSSNQINGRQRDMCIVSGVKINATFKNTFSDRIYVNWGVIHGKQGQAISASTTDFFRDYNNNRTFDAAHVNKTGLTSSVAQINTDEFVVLKRGKFLLTPGNNTDGNAMFYYNHNNRTKEVSIWCKLGRSFYFDDTSDEPTDQIYFVWWFSYPEEPTTSSTTQVCDCIIRSITFFREPKTA